MRVSRGMLPSLVERGAPWALAAVVLVGSLSTYRQPWRPELVSAAALGAVACVRARLNWVPLAVVAGASYVLLGMWPAMVVSSYYAATMLRRSVQVAAYAVGAMLVVGVPAWVGGMLGTTRWGLWSPGNAVLSLAGLVLGPMVVGLWVSARRQVIEALRDRAERLAREHVALAERARSGERTRIAREMHDVVAHRVTLMVLAAGALEVGAQDDRTAAAAARIRHDGQGALKELRQVLGILRTAPDGTELAPQPGLDDLDDLVTAARAGGTPVGLQFHGEPDGLSTATGHAAYRVVQESLLNARKHAPGASVDILVTAGARAGPGRHPGITLDVRNSPRPDSGPDLGATKDPTPDAHEPTDGHLSQGGWGLVGLAERARLLGGTLETGPTDEGGFRVRAELPA